MHGQVFISLPDNSIFIDNFDNGVRKGKCLLIKEDGSVVESEWKDGKLDGEQIIADPNGEVIKTIYENNEILTCQTLQGDDRLTHLSLLMNKPSLIL